MPKLNKKIASEVAKSDAWRPDGGRALLEDGLYAGRLVKVEERDGREYPNWSWWFDGLFDAEGNGHSGVQFLNTSLSPKAAGRMRQAFDAFGYSPDSDTDEIVGEWAVLHIKQEIQQYGQRAGQMVNQVTGVSEFDPNEWDFDPESVPAYQGRDSGDRVEAAAF